MSQLKKMAAATLLVTAAGVNAGGSLDLSLSNEVVRAAYDLSLIHI